ncbi:cupin domain-containing protein [Sporolactobacillus sp. THM7-7]|nr:cupin domain-containing protein [Sporolactobacillus sp. THM7-7]
MGPDYSAPSLRLFGDSTTTINYRRDAHNDITQLFGAQLPAIRNGFFNVHMSRGIIIQPHWHTNVTEMVFMISGEVITSVFNPFTRRLMSYRLKPGQVSIFPKGWFHWILALTDNVHLLTIFDQPTPDIVYGSDFLRFTPKEVVNRAYCVNAEAYAEAIEPIKESVILGPPPGCVENNHPAYTNLYQRTYRNSQPILPQSNPGQYPNSAANPDLPKSYPNHPFSD